MRVVVINEIRSKLNDFKKVDKYETFYKILPAVEFSPEDQKSIVSDILNNCCDDFITLHDADKKPLQSSLKKVFIKCMNELTIANIDTPNREFGYELCWYLSEKVGLKLKKTSENKIWGFWKVEEEEVKTIELRNSKNK